MAEVECRILKDQKQTFDDVSVCASGSRSVSDSAILLEAKISPNYIGVTRTNRASLFSMSALPQVANREWHTALVADEMATPGASLWIGT